MSDERLTDDEWTYDPDGWTPNEESLRAQDERWRAELREILRRPAPWKKGEKWGTRFSVLMFGVPALILGVGAIRALT